MPISSLRPALITATTVAAVTLSLGLGSSATAEDEVVSPGLPADTSTAVSPVAAASGYLETPGVAPLAAPIGFGAATTGGAGGRLLHVTNAQDSVSAPAEGSLRWAVQQPGPKWIVFDVDMTIALSAPLPLTSDTTIDGRGRQVTITGPGLTGLQIHDVTNVVIENLALRGFGDTTYTYVNNADDAISVQRASRVWIDHTSLSVAGDKLVSVADGVREMTLTWNHFFEQQQTMQIGSISTANNDTATTVTVAYNHFDHVGYRTPVVSYGKAHVLNNFLDTWLVGGVRSERLAQIYLENNVFLAGSAPKATMIHPGQGCNDAGTLCDSRPGYLLDTGNMFLGKTKTESTGPGHMFDPASAYAYTALPASTALAGVIAGGAGANATGLAANPLIHLTTKVRAKNTKSGNDRIKIVTHGGVATGYEAAIYRRTASGGWAKVKTVRLNQRGQAQVELTDRARAAKAKYVVEIAATDATLDSRSNVAAVR